MSGDDSKRSTALLPLTVAVALSALAGYVGWTLGSTATPASADAESGSPEILTEFRLPSLDGTEVSPRDFDGEIVLVDFWATWCSPCKVQTRIIEGLREEYEERGVNFLAVSLGEDRETVAKYVEDHPFSYPVLYDTEDLVATGASIYALPTVMVVDRKGEVSYLKAGLSGANHLREALDSAAL